MLPYAELHSHSCFSFLDGADTPKDLARRAAELGLQALALTDHNAIYGIIPFIEATKRYGIQPIIGSEMTLESGFHLTLLVENEAGYRNLCYLITVARHHATKGKGILPLSELQGHTQGLIALSGCRRGEIRQAIQQKRYSDALAIAKRYLEWFGYDNFWIELQCHDLPHEKRIVKDLVNLANHLSIGYVASNNVHYATSDQQQLQDVMVCIRHNITTDVSHRIRRPNGEYYLKSPQQMAALFAEYPEAISNTTKIANRCHFEPRYGLQDLPTFPTPHGQSASDYLRQLCENALGNSKRKDMPQAILLLQHELRVIEKSGLSNYFLIVADIVRFARENGILCQGRGSAANSLVAYLLGISPVDPLTHSLVFERFLSEERVSVPDIDIDFPTNRREDVIHYVLKKYGAAHVAMAATFITYKRRMAIRDVGKALGISPSLLEEIALIGDRDDTIPITSAQIKLFVTLCEQIQGLPRHLGMHNGGIVMMGAPLYQRLPTEPSALDDWSVLQFDKDMLEKAGLIKIDFLGLRMLQAIRETMTLVESKTGKPLELSALYFDDPALYQMMSKGDTIGVFQLESSAQKNLLPRFKPQKYNDIIKVISMIRPGPIKAGTVQNIVDRHIGVEAISYPHPLLQAALEETYGLLLFQEQVIKTARDLAGFTAGQGELLRRALGGKRPENEVERLRNLFITGALKNEVTLEIAEQVFQTVKDLGGYSFPKSHAAAFAVLVYESAYLKHYWPAEFGASLLNAQPMGFWSPAVIVNDLRRHGIGLKRVDIHKSSGDCTVEDNHVRIGFRYISGIGDNAVRRIENARQEGEFHTLADFCKRAKLPRKLTEKLILVGAFDDWGIERRKLILALGNIENNEGGLNLIFPDNDVNLIPLSEVELFSLETQVMGLSTGRHIMSFYEEWMRKKRILGSHELETVKDGLYVQVAGASVMHQAPPTAKGFHFLTLEGKEGMISVIVRPSVYKQYKHVMRHAPLLWIKGKLQREGDVINILCESAAHLPRLTYHN